MVPPRPIVAGEPLLTMRNISSLNDLAPWFRYNNIPLRIPLYLNVLPQHPLVGPDQAADQEHAQCGGQPEVTSGHY